MLLGSLALLRFCLRKDLINFFSRNRATRPVNPAMCSAIHVGCFIFIAFTLSILLRGYLRWLWLLVILQLDAARLHRFAVPRLLSLFELFKSTIFDDGYEYYY